MRSKAGQYLGFLVAGAALEETGKALRNSLPTEKPAMETPKGKKFSENMQRKNSFDDDYVNSFDARKWELPNVGQGVIDTAKYVVSTNESERRQDFGAAVVETGKQAILQAPERLSEIPEKLHNTKQNYDAFRQDGNALEQQANTVVQEKGADMMQSFGRNAMLKAPGYLIPGPVGFMYRSFFTAKMIGNAGRQINEFNEIHENLPGPFKEQVQKRNASKK